MKDRADKTTTWIAWVKRYNLDWLAFLLNSAVCILGLHLELPLLYQVGLGGAVASFLVVLAFRLEL